MQTSTILPSEIRVLYNHIYEYKKGVRNLILCTMNTRHAEMAYKRLHDQQIPYLVQAAGRTNINLYFGQPECLEAIRTFVDKPLNRLTPEEDFMLGALLGYDICRQCKRFCERKTPRMTSREPATTIDVASRQRQGILCRIIPRRKDGFLPKKICKPRKKDLTLQIKPNKRLR